MSLGKLEDVREKALLLGMVYSEEERPLRGQEYRDRVRCESLEKIGYKVRASQCLLSCPAMHHLLVPSS